MNNYQLITEEYKLSCLVDLYDLRIKAYVLNNVLNVSVLTSAGEELMTAKWWVDSDCLANVTCIVGYSQVFRSQAASLEDICTIVESSMLDLKPLLN